MSEGRKIPFGLFSLPFHTLKLLAGALILLVKGEWKNSATLWLQMLRLFLRCFICPTYHPWFLLLQEFDHVQMSLLFIVTVHIMLVPLVPLLGFLEVFSLLRHRVLKRNAPIATVNGLSFPQAEPARCPVWFVLTSNSRSLLRKFFSSQWNSNISGGPTDFSVASSNSVFDILANSPTFS